MTLRLCGLALIGPFLVLGCGRGAPPPMAGGMPVPNVTTAKSHKQDVPVYLDEIGTCTAVEYVSVFPQVTGIVTDIKFTDGADLHKGDPLFIIDPRPYKAAQDQAQANADQAKAAVDLASREYDRYNNLLASHAVSQNDYDTRKNAKDVADAQLSASQAEVETAKLNLEYCTIVSPIDGRAGQRKVDRGNVVKANEGSMLIIQRLDQIYVDFTVNERELPNVRAKAARNKLVVQARLPSETQQDARSGELTFIDTGVQDQAGTVKLRATLKNDDHHLWPGQFVNVRLILEVKKDAVLVPAGAIQVGQAGPYVYAAQANPKDPTGLIAVLQPVTIGQRQGEEYVVEKGIQPNEMLVTTGQWQIIPGFPIKDVPSPAAMGSSDSAGGSPTGNASAVETQGIGPKIPATQPASNPSVIPATMP